MTNCACVYVGENDGPQFFSEKTVKARKAHICGECRCEIKAGQEYEHVSGLWEDFERQKTCLDCVAIRDSLFCDGFSYGFVFEDLREAIRDGLEISEDCLAGLPPRARGLVCELIQNYWDGLS